MLDRKQNACDRIKTKASQANEAFLMIHYSF